MRNRFAQVFYDLARADTLLNLVVADISPAGSIEKFRKEFPNRFVNTGVAEQIMIGIAAGMAQRGLKPFVYTIATFALYRPFEFIRVDLCYQDLPVTIVGIGGGLTYSTLGATHHAQEDIAVASTLPNLNIIAPCDPDEVEEAVRWCATDRKSGPIYLRLGKAGEPNLTSNSLEPWSFGKIRLVKKGSGIAIFSYGTIARLATVVNEKLSLEGVESSLYFVSTLKPLDYRRIDSIFEMYSQIVIVEEHINFGGLSQAIKVYAQEKSWGGKVFSFSLPNSFSHSYSSHDDILKSVGLSSENILFHLRP